MFFREEAERAEGLLSEGRGGLWCVPDHGFVRLVCRTVPSKEKTDGGWKALRIALTGFSAQRVEEFSMTTIRATRCLYHYCHIVRGL